MNPLIVFLGFTVAVGLQVRDLGNVQSVSTLRGQVVLADQEDVAVSGAVVTLVGDGLTRPVSATVDESGRFVIRGLPPGIVRVTAAKPGYLMGSSMQPDFAATAVAVEAGRESSVRLRLRRGAVVAGTLTFEQGEPLPDAWVWVVENRRDRAPGFWTTTYTDDRGRYRVAGLPPGRYAVAAVVTTAGIGPLSALSELPTVPSDEGQLASPGAQTAHRPVSFVPIFFPGTPTPSSATLISVAAGTIHDGIDFEVSPTRTSRLDVDVISESGAPAVGVDLGLLGPAGSLGLRNSSSPTTQASSVPGRTIIENVAPGSYTIVVKSGHGPSPRAFGRAVVHVGSEATHTVQVAMRSTIRVSGRLIADGSLLAQPNWSVARLRLDEEESMGVSMLALDASSRSNSAQTTVNPDGTFAFTGLVPGRYRFSLVLPAGPQWTLATARLGQDDILDSGLDLAESDVAGLTVTLTDRSTEIAGVVLRSDGAAASEIVVAIAPREDAFRQSPRRVIMVKTATDGSYRAVGLPAGAYLLGAAKSLDLSTLSDANVIDQLRMTALEFGLALGEVRRLDFMLP